VPKKIAQISKNDRKVSIVGTVVSSTDDSFVLDDGSGKIEVFFEKENAEGRERIKKDKTIRAFCTLVGEQLKLDVAQSADGLDLNLLKTVDDLYSKAGI